MEKWLRKLDGLVVCLIVLAGFIIAYMFYTEYTKPVTPKITPPAHELEGVIILQPQLQVKPPEFKKLVVEATAYWYLDPVDASGTGLAADGNPAIPYRTIAVDPNVIPLGSEVFVPGIGWCLAHDTGGAIIGNKIDIAMDSREAAFNWGRRSIEIQVK